MDSISISSSALTLAASGVDASISTTSPLMKVIVVTGQYGERVFRPTYSRAARFLWQRERVWSRQSLGNRKGFSDRQKRRSLYDSRGQPRQNLVNPALGPPRVTEQSSQDHVVSDKQPQPNVSNPSVAYRGITFQVRPNARLSSLARLTSGVLSRQLNCSQMRVAATKHEKLVLLRIVKKQHWMFSHLLIE